MATLNFFWKLWLRPNLLTHDVTNDYIAEVSTVGNTVRNEELARRFVAEGSELKYETILNVLARRDKLVREALQQGTSVQDGVAHIAPRVLGNWIGAEAKFDPRQHKITCDMTPTAELRAALAEVGAEVLGVKENGAYIGLVTDAATGKTDGTITAGDDIIIEGDKIKIAPEGETGPGVFFVAADGSETPVSRRYTENTPKKVIARVPALAAGAYTLVVRTKYTSGNNVLKDLRSISYSQPLTVA